MSSLKYTPINRQLFLRCVLIGQTLDVESRSASRAPDVVEGHRRNLGQPNQLGALAVGTSWSGGIEHYWSWRNPVHSLLQRAYRHRGAVNVRITGSGAAIRSYGPVTFTVTVTPCIECSKRAMRPRACARPGFPLARDGACYVAWAPPESPDGHPRSRCRQGFSPFHPPTLSGAYRSAVES